MDNVIDVICQHTRDGSIIPLRIRMLDEDGQFQTFTIKSYNDYSYKGEFITLPNQVVVNALNSWIFRCQIQVLNRLQTITIYYNKGERKWRWTK